ncbi:nicotinate-nucleotide--dimethylbenzimidazole phosphoribosyltransferase [Hamadaea flava]|uniref:Adenosylcobinamide kinase n=1 Tax=Hamadaea flava TaxID=1742688 RepID=A0ABV8LU87_9ACTN|nr:bifunctional adenosylcobinamide kinase/adenosylcobinamide-phosphate guanylyltransferase [Hamadaea flava]MCP2327819.1 nicotinate-nucleotide--dimethylbenzimidazole phosphoribosyltransferase [Hamadaea flava]
MAQDLWTAALVLGGIRSGKSDFAEGLATEAAAGGVVRYVATAQTDPADEVWQQRIEAHRARRPAGWTTEELEDPTDLLVALRTAEAGEVLLVDDLGGWATRLLPLTAEERRERIDALGRSVAACAGQVVLVSPEVGLSLVPATESGADFADLVGEINQIVADAADRVALIIAGQTSWLKPAGGPSADGAPARPVSTSQPAQAVEMDVPEVITPVAEPDTAGGALTEPTMALPMIATGLVIQANMELPLPDEEAERDAKARLGALDLPGSGFGKLAKPIRFAAATQRAATPHPWRSVRMMLLYADHEGNIAAGVDVGDSAHWAAQARAGAGPIGLLAARTGATIQVVDAATAGDIEWVDAATPEAVEAGLRHGWRLAEEAVDAGVDLIALGSCGAGADTVAATLISAMTSAELAALLGRRVSADGSVDDNSWMLRCAAARDALNRLREDTVSPKMLLARIGGVDFAIAVGILLGATARRTPVLMDGPVAIASALLARDLAGQVRHWCLLPDAGGDPATLQGADVLGLEPFLDLRLGLGEGASALAALPLIQSAISLAQAADGPEHAGEGLTEPPGVQSVTGRVAAPETADGVPVEETEEKADLDAADGLE